LTVELTPHSHPATGGDKATWAWQQQQKKHYSKRWQLSLNNRAEY